MSAQHGTIEPHPVAPKTRLSVVAPVDAGLGDDAVAFPCEEALLARVALPLASHRQRRAAAGFAVEDMIAEPLEASHVVLGPELGPGEYLVVVVRRSVMESWTRQTDAARSRLVPDVLALPAPAAGGASVREVNGRVLLRRADGTGFAVPVAAFETFWRAEGAPQVVLFGGRLPEGVPVSASGLMPAAPTSEALAFDLLRGGYARDFGGWRKALLRLCAVFALALAAHLAILGADAAALRRIVAEHEATLRAELLLRAPDLSPGTPLDLALRRAMPEAAPTAGGGFLSLMTRVAEALAPVSADIAVRNLAFTAADGSLALLLEAPDLATLQRAENDLAAAGLAVASGVATTGDGAAEVRYTITGSGQ